MQHVLHFHTCSAPTARFGLLYRNILFFHAGEHSCRKKASFYIRIIGRTGPPETPFSAKIPKYSFITGNGSNKCEKKSKIRVFLAKLWYFFPGASIWSLFFSFELWVTVPPLRLPRARSRVTAWSPFFRHSFHNENFILQQPLQSMHKVQVSNCNSWFYKWRYLVYLRTNGSLLKKGNLAPNARRWTVFF